MIAQDLYLGTWELVPELSLYEFGPAPASGVYVIEESAAGVRIGIRWTLADEGPESQMEFGGPADGSRQVLEPNAAPGAAGVAFSLTRIDSRTLDSQAFRGDEPFAYARRVASKDGELLAVVQEGQRPEGGRFRNFQVYRRRKEAGLG